MPRLELQSVRRTFRQPEGREVHAVRDLDLVVESGGFLVLVGPSGCGKTTLLRLVCGLERPDQGSVKVGGREITTVPAAERDVALVFQGGALFPHLSARENLALGLRLRRCPRVEIGRRVGEMAERLGLTAVLPRRPGDLSAGERQRVALGRALIRRPAVLLLDEPLANLDAPARCSLRAEVLGAHRGGETTVVLVTHDQEEAWALGQPIAVMLGGRILQTGTPAEIRTRPVTAEVADFIRAPSHVRSADG